MAMLLKLQTENTSGKHDQNPIVHILKKVQGLANGKKVLSVSVAGVLYDSQQKLLHFSWSPENAQFWTEKILV